MFLEKLSLIFGYRLALIVGDDPKRTAWRKENIGT
jgi:hypothetical protein